MNIRLWVASALLAAGSLFGLAGAAFAADNAISTAYVNARSCGSTSCGVLYVLPPDTTVEVISTTGSWCQQNRSGFPTAWVSCSYLTALPGGGGGGGGGGSGGGTPVNFCFTGPGGGQICIGSGGVSGTAPPAPPPPPPPSPSGDACFYANNGYGGDDICESLGTTRSALGGTWNDRISSLEVLTGGTKVLVCQHAGFTGVCAQYTGDVNSLPGGLNNEVSSYAVYAGPLPGGTLPYGPDTCQQGYVWRDARPGDHVCVTGAERNLAANENAIAPALWTPGPYGPHTCLPGYVWREALPGDDVCTSGARRTAVQVENANGPSHRVIP